MLYEYTSRDCLLFVICTKHQSAFRSLGWKSTPIFTQFLTYYIYFRLRMILTFVDILFKFICFRYSVPYSCGYKKINMIIILLKIRYSIMHSEQTWDYDFNELLLNLYTAVIQIVPH